MEEIFDRASLARKYPDFAKHFIQGNILILKNGGKRIIRFTNMQALRPGISFVRRLLNDFYPEHNAYDDAELEACLSGDAEIVIYADPALPVNR